MLKKLMLLIAPIALSVVAFGSPPVVHVSVSAADSDLSVTAGTTLTVSGHATDSDGDMPQHWLEIQNPAGSWSWEGWLTSSPWDGTLGGSTYDSTKSGTFTFTDLGSYSIRTTAIDSSGIWIVSNVVHVQVSAAAVDVPVSAPDVIAPVDVSAPSTPVVVTPTTPVTTPSTPVSTGPIFRSDGSVDPSAYASYFSNWDASSVSARLGPTFASLNPSAGDDRPTNYKPASISNPYQSFLNRTDPYEIGPAGGPFSDGNYWSESGQVAYVPDDPVGDPGLDRVEVFAYYNHVFAISPRLDLGTLGHPDPQAIEYGYYLLQGSYPKQAVAMVRNYAMLQNEALVVYKNGLLAVAGTQTSRESWERPYPGLMLPPNKVPTAIAVTSSNEFALITVWDTNTQKGQIAVVALEGKYIAYHTWPYMALPNQGSWSDLKLLGFVDLPMAAPSSIAAASNGWWEGPSQTAGEVFSQIDLTNPWTRDGLYEGDAQWSMIVANKGYAIVASKLENKTVLVDLSPLFNYARQSYLSSTDSYWNTVNTRGSGPGQWPLTFAEKPDILPQVVWQGNFAAPTSVLAGLHIDRWSEDRQKAYVATEDGTIHILDTSPLMARYSWETVGSLGEMGSLKVGRNPTSMAFMRHADYAPPVLPAGINGSPGVPDPLNNVFYVACRGDREVDGVVTYAGNGAVYRRIRDSRMGDPVAVSVAGRGNIVSVADFNGRKLLSFRVGGLVDNDGRYYGAGSDGKSDFEFAGEMSFSGYPFLINSANVN